MTARVVAENYYVTTLAEKPAYPALAHQAEADVCIIGGGLAGLNLALSLGERGRRVVVLEAHDLGHGASGRNAGFVAKGYAGGDLALIDRLGLEKARALVALTKNARQLIRSRVAAYGIDCAPMHDGVLTVSWKDDPRALQDSIARANEAFDLGFEFWPRLRVREHCNTERYYDGIFSPHDFQFNPLKYLYGLAHAAVSRGAAIHENSAALSLSRKGAQWEVRTAGGSVRAKDVVLCGSVYMKGLNRRLDNAAIPVRTYIMVTAPIAEEVYQRSVNTAHAIYDNRFSSDFYRRLPEGRLLWGGRVSLFAHPQDIAQSMTEDLLKVYPQMRGHVAPDFAWGGLLSYASHKMPMMDRLDEGLWCNTGFGGHGIAPTTVAGEAMAAALTGDDSVAAQFAPFRPRFAGGPLGRYGAYGVYLWWRLRDYLS